MSTTTLPTQQRSRTVTANRWVYRISRYWLLIFSLMYGLFVGMPFLAPVLMQIGWQRSAKVIYFAYSWLCHQMPQRSFFMFGQGGMYSLDEIQAAWQVTLNPLILRQFIGIPSLGWKVAWSDRMVSLYTSILFFAWLWWPLRKKIKSLPLWGFALLMLPMAVDGVTHFIGDLSGIGQGFRDTNTWLALLTDHTFASTFYVGDAFGSFNSWMRLITGTLFGLSIVWLGFPLLEDFFTDLARNLEAKFQRADLTL
jgi:uncharacterized membrane protein